MRLVRLGSNGPGEPRPGKRGPAPWAEFRNAEIVEPAEHRPLRAPSLFRQYKRISTQDYRDGRKDNSRCKLRDLFYFWCGRRGAVANGGFWGGCVDNAGSCGVVLKLSNRFFGALAGVRFFFGFRPRLLGIGKQ